MSLPLKIPLTACKYPHIYFLIFHGHIPLISLCFILKNIYSDTFLLENRTVRQPQHSPPRWVIGTGQLGRLRFRPGPLPVGGGGIIPFSIFVMALVTAMYIFIRKSRQIKRSFQASLWAGQGQNTVLESI